MGKDGTVGKDAIEGKILGLYFSAHWCPPCRGFTPKLAETYNKVKAKHPNFELVFVSSDRDEKSWKEYYETMPWLALPYENRSAKNGLSSLFGIQGIPAFVLLDEDRNVINKNARGSVDADPEGNEFPWYPKKVNDITDCEGIEETPSFVMLVENEDAAAQKKIEADVTVVAEEVYKEAKTKKSDPEFLFFLAKDSSAGPMTQIKKLCGLDGGSSVKALLLDIDDNGGFYEIQEEISADVVRKTMENYKNKKLERKQFQ